MELKPIVKEWLTALRSGNIPQTQGVLADVATGGRCCLGVACDIAVEYGVIPPPQEYVLMTPTGDRKVLSYNGESMQLPEAVRYFFGIDSSTGGYGKTKDIYNSLTKLNDRDKKTFSEIADVIESNPAGLFRPTVVEAGIQYNDPEAAV